jgi:hypothetical protein
MVLMVQAAQAVLAFPTVMARTAAWPALRHGPPYGMARTLRHGPRYGTGLPAAWPSLR